VAGKDDYPKETPTPAAVASPGTATAALDPPAPAFDVSSLLSRLPKPDPTQYYQIATVAFKASLEAEVGSVVRYVFQLFLVCPVYQVAARKRWQCTPLPFRSIYFRKDIFIPVTS